jgi:hypothetical protein
MAGLPTTPSTGRAAVASRLLVLLAAALCAATLARTAESADCSPWHCYGYADWQPSTGYHGGIAYLNASSLHVDSHCDAFAADILWVFDAYGNRWIETGLINGTHPPNGGCFGLWYFWAEQIAEGFFAYYYGGASYNTNFAARIEYIGDTMWQILRSGSPLDYTIDHPAPSRQMQAGLENSGDTGFNSDVRAHTFQKQASFGGGWSYNWPGSQRFSTGGAGVAWCGVESCIDAWLLG